VQVMLRQRLGGRCILEIMLVGFAGRWLVEATFWRHAPCQMVLEQRERGWCLGVGPFFILCFNFVLFCFWNFGDM